VGRSNYEVQFKIPEEALSKIPAWTLAVVSTFKEENSSCGSSY